MQINHGNRFDFTREFYAINVKENGDVDIQVVELTIFQRIFRSLFGAYSNTIWNERKFNQLTDKAKEIVRSTIKDPDVFKSVFKVAKVSQPHFSQVASERPAPASMSSWKKFGREQLQAELNKIGLQFKESIEKGDCFFDSFAYLLTTLRKDKQYTAQDIRTDIANYLKRDDVPHDKYKALLKQNRVDTNSYEKYKENISRCASEGYDPIWGDDLAIQIVCDLYGVNVTVHSTLMLEATLLDTLEGGQYEDFPFIDAADHKILVCTKLIDKSFKGKNPKAETVHIAHIENGPWAHFLPVIKK